MVEIKEESDIRRIIIVIRESPYSSEMMDGIKTSIQEDYKFQDQGRQKTNESTCLVNVAHFLIAGHYDHCKEYSMLDHGFRTCLNIQATLRVLEMFSPV